MQESGEMYLETILILGKSKPRVRAIDIVEYMGFSKPSVSRALSKLKADGFVNVDEKSSVSLTEEGLKVANTMYERHLVISAMLEGIGVDKDIAARDACKIEHDISEMTFDAIKRHMQKIGVVK